MKIETERMNEVVWLFGVVGDWKGGGAAIGWVEMLLCIMGNLMVLSQACSLHGVLQEHGLSSQIPIERT